MKTRSSTAIDRFRMIVSGLGATAVSAICLLYTAGALATALEQGAIPPQTASLQPLAAAPEENPPDAGPTTEIKIRLDKPGGLMVAGERLHGGLLRQFYARHNYEPVWTSREPQANALLAAVMRADEHGLDPDLFHAALLRNPAGLSPPDRELVLSDAFLAFADALARGAVPIEIRMDDEDLTPTPVDVAAELDKAISSPDPAGAIEALAPSSPEYAALRRALHAYRTHPETALPARAAAPDHRGHRPPPAMSNDARLRTVEVNLERLRWLPRQLPGDRVWVNLANAQLVFYRSDRPAFTTRVIIGQTDKQTPEFRTTIDSVLFNPPWNVPYSIVTKEIRPKLSQDPDYLARHHMVWRRNGLIEQLPGHGGTALGQLKFEMVDRYDVYLHDTPQKNLFALDNRRQSHGCVRIQNPRELAALLLQQPVEMVNKGVALGYTNRRMLPASMPVFLVYQTAFAEPDATIAFRPDVYDRDPEIWQHLHRLQQAPVAAGELAGQRRG